MNDPDPSLNFFGESQGIFVSMLGQFDQQPLYNAVNFGRSIFASANSTVVASGLKVLWCLSDPSIQMEVEYPFFEEPLKEKVHFSSYAGCTGTWYPALSDFPDPLNAARINQINGLFTADRGVRVAEITDGTSQTMLLSERAHGSRPATSSCTGTGGPTPSQWTRASGQPFHAERPFPQDTRHPRDLQQCLHIVGIVFPPERCPFRLRRRIGPVLQRFDRLLGD